MRLRTILTPPAALIAAAAILSGCAASHQASLLEPPQRVLTLTVSELDALAARGRVARLAGPARCGVESHRIVYRTVGGAGEPVTSSAAVLTPRGAGPDCSGPRPMVMYARGTSFLRDADMAKIEASEPDSIVAATLFAAQGYVVVAPNYVGYAASNADYHPYYQLEAQASDAIDALLAARASASATQTPPASKLFLVGYSQGGAVALATQRALERPGAPADLKVSAVAASAGATMIAEMARTVFAGQPSVGATGFLPLLVASYQRAYTGFPSADQIYAPPFGAPNGMPALPGALTFPQLLAQGKLPVNLFDRQDGKPFLIKPSFRESFNNDPQNPLRRAFEANQLDGFKPIAPLLLCHGRKDPLVTIANTDAVARAYAAKGATVARIDLEDAASPLAQGFQTALDAAVSAGASREVAYHFVGMPFCNAAARAFFERSTP